MPSPHRASRAGSSVSDASTATTTTIAAAWPSIVMKRQAGDRQREQGDDDGAAGERHGATGRRRRVADGVVDAATLMTRRAGPGDDEQRIVDADAEADHRRDGRRHVGDREACARAATRCSGRSARPTIALTIGSAMAVTVPKTSTRISIAASDADQLAGLGLGLGDLGAELAAGRDLDVGALGRLESPVSSDRLGLLDAQVAERLRRGRRSRRRSCRPRRPCVLPSANGSVTDATAGFSTGPRATPRPRRGSRGR